MSSLYWSMRIELEYWICDIAPPAGELSSWSKPHGENYLVAPASVIEIGINVVTLDPIGDDLVLEVRFTNSLRQSQPREMIYA